jgi:hypothetical protein
MTRTRFLGAALAASLIVPATVFAKVTSPAVGTYKLTGTYAADSKPFAAQVKVELGGGDAALSVTSKTDDTKDPNLDWTGLAKLNRLVLTITPKSEAGVGFIGALDGDKNAVQSRIELVATFDSDKFEHATVTIDQVVTKAGKSTRTHLGSGELKETLLDELKEEAGELVILGRKKVRELTDKGIHGDKGLDLFGGFLHIGVQVGVRTLGADEESDQQKAADAAQEGKNPIWIETTAEGGPIVGHTTTIPLNGAGTLSLQVGFQALVNVRYAVQDQYTLQPDIAVQLAKKEVRAAKVPIDAKRALAMPLGSRRELEGSGSIATSGELIFGAAFLDELQHATNDFAEFRADASVGVTFTVTGDYKVEVDRQEDSLVHVHWSRVQSREFDVDASLAVGLVANDDKIGTLKKPTQTVVNAIVNRVGDYAVLKIDLSHDNSHERDLDVDMVIDLASPKGADAYDKAIKGDLRSAHQLHHMKDGSIKSWSIVSKLTDSVTTDASLSLFKLLTLNASRENGHTYELVSTDRGAQATDTFDHKRKSGWLVRLFGGSDKEVDATATARTVRALGSPTQRGLHLTIDYTRHDQKTSADDLNDRLNLAREFFGDAPAAPLNQKKFGPTDVNLSVEMGTKALDTILKATDDEFYAAYGSAIWDKSYTWGPSQVKALKKVSLIMENNETTAQYNLRMQAWALRDADAILKIIHQAQKSGATTVTQARAFRDMIDKNSLKLYAVIALTHLAGSDDAKVSISIKGGDTTFFDKAAGTASDLPMLPGAPGSDDSGGDN